MRFGLFVPQGWRCDLVGIDPADQWAAMRDVARHADAGPWESVWVYDHFHTVPQPTDEACHEAWTLMAALGAATERVRLGQMCTCMSYRNPVYLAKVAATCDVVSGGRVEMGIGGGWYEHEWRAYGYGFPSAGVRRSANYNVAVGATEAEVEDRLQQLRSRLTPVVGAERAEGQLGGYRGLPACGTPEQIVENLRALEAAGMTYGIFYFPEAAHDRSGIELFEREVVPALAS